MEGAKKAAIELIAGLQAEHVSEELIEAEAGDNLRGELKYKGQEVLKRKRLQTRSARPRRDLPDIHEEFDGAISLEALALE